jgi:hypothetical protein
MGAGGPAGGNRCAQWYVTKSQAPVKDFDFLPTSCIFCFYQLFEGAMALLGHQLGVAAPQKAAQDHAAAMATFESVTAPSNPSAAPPSPPNGEINLNNILALIPGEVVPLYITGSGLKVDPIHGVSWTVLVFWLCFFICGVLRAQASKPAGTVGVFKGVNLQLVAVSLVAFFVWAEAVSTQAQGPLITALPSAAWGFIAMVLGVLAPLVVPSAPTK